LRFPESAKNWCISQQKALVFDNDNIKYDIILGTNFFSKAGVKLNYLEGKMEWLDCSIPLCPPGGQDSKKFGAMEGMFFILTKDELFGEDCLHCKPLKIWLLLQMDRRC
jgi:hypothetical protein